MSMTIKADLGGLNRLMGKLGTRMQEAARPAAQPVAAFRPSPSLPFRASGPPAPAALPALRFNTALFNGQDRYFKLQLAQQAARERALAGTVFASSSQGRSSAAGGRSVRRRVSCRRRRRR